MAGREEKSRDIMVAQSGYNIYSDVSSSTGNQNIPAAQFMSHLAPPPTQQSFDPSTASTSAAEIYNLTAGMEMIGFPSKHHHHQHTAENPGFWKGFFSSATKPTGNNNNNNGGASSSSSKEITDDPTSADHFYQHQQNYSDAIQNHTPPSSSSWNNIHHQNRFLSDDGGGGGGGGAVFPCEGNERPSQGLSLSLSSSNPSTIQLQSFQLIRNQQQHQNQNQHVINMQSDVLMHHHQHVIDNHHNHQSHAVITNSKYLLPTQELLYEFCSLQTNEIDHKSKPPKPTDSSLLDETTAIKTLDLLELQRRKTKLLQMLEEVDRRYKRYCDQMKAVISSFESTAGNGSARVYSSLASRAMSRHFRCLRDGIVSQIKAAKKAMGDKDVSAPGSVKGETPRLRLLDQTLRQQRAMQQMSLMESHPWRPQRGLPERSVSVLRAWLFEHFLHPYPSDVDKHILARQTGLSRSQVSNWFINARVRLWKPMVEEMYLEELKEDEAVAGDGGGGGGGGATVYENDGLMSSQNHSRSEDLKPSHDQLVRMDSECLSSIINNNNEAKRNKGGAAAAVQNEQHHQINPSFGRVMGDSYGSSAMELDFSSYSHHSSGGGSGVHYGGGGGGGVSLTLGLHQHGGGGVGLGTTQNSMFYGGRSEQMVEDNNQYTLLDGGENQNLPYRNLMGAQLLHDLAG